ncbi:carbon-nitrogen hydrolase [Neoconidiobolus thromboides FSU 785]|nr:carbon-nitrogen hydrolase [Neoconidiobolus thromboides FSU 785]
MSLTGYMFENQDDIKAYVDLYDPIKLLWKGKNVSWGIKLTKQYNITLILSFPEKNISTENYYNSCVVIDPNGMILHHYQKHFLYLIDERWAMSGPSFSTFCYQQKKLGIGICMDLNNSNELDSFMKFEFATYHHQMKTEIIIITMNWILSDKLFYFNLFYWLFRLSPLLKELEKEIIIIGCNRIGTEKDITFTGTSFAIKFSKQLQQSSENCISLLKFIKQHINLEELTENQLTYLNNLLDYILPYINHIYILNYLNNNEEDTLLMTI